jgi:prepilin-type N-terminal cleavage/methylation domain-containing protein
MLGMTLLEIMIVLAILALVMGLLVGPQVLKLFAQGKGDIAAAGVKKLAYESYPQWASRPANTGKCPTVQQLAEYGGSIKDPFGEEYVIKCTDLPAGANGVAVFSKGEDKREGTGDDIKSWEQQ